METCLKAETAGRQPDRKSRASPFVTDALLTPSARASAACVGYTPSSSAFCQARHRARVASLI